MNAFERDLTFIMEHSKKESVLLESADAPQQDQRYIFEITSAGASLLLNVAKNNEFELEQVAMPERWVELGVPEVVFLDKVASVIMNETPELVEQQNLDQRTVNVTTACAMTYIMNRLDRLNETEAYAAWAGKYFECAWKHASMYEDDSDFEIVED